MAAAAESRTISERSPGSLMTMVPSLVEPSVGTVYSGMIYANRTPALSPGQADAIDRWSGEATLA